MARWRMSSGLWETVRMYKLSDLHEYDPEPWNTDLYERIRFVNRCVAEKKKIVLEIYHHADTSTFRYRCYNVFQQMKDHEEWRTVYFFHHELQHAVSFLESVCCVILVRVMWTYDLQCFIDCVKMKKIPLLFDVDDLVFDVDYLPLVFNTLRMDFNDENSVNGQFCYFGRLDYTARQADGYIATNDYLGKILQNKYERPFGVIPNFLNDEQMRVSEGLRSQKKRKQSVRPFTIGYFSGSPSHANDFTVVSPELIQLMKKYSDIHLLVVGFMEFPSQMRHFIDLGRVRFKPLVDFIALQKLIAEVDVNLVPLIDNTFTNCKSELKFFEAAIVDTPTCATPTYTYRSCISTAHNGFLCRQGEWFPVLESIYLEKTDTASILKRAYEDSVANYSGESVTKKITQALSLSQEIRL